MQSFDAARLKSIAGRCVTGLAGPPQASPGRTGLGLDPTWQKDPQRATAKRTKARGERSSHGRQGHGRPPLMPALARAGGVLAASEARLSAGTRTRTTKHRHIGHLITHTPPAVDPPLLRTPCWIACRVASGELIAEPAQVTLGSSFFFWHLSSFKTQPDSLQLVARGVLVQEGGIEQQQQQQQHRPRFNGAHTHRHADAHEAKQQPGTQTQNIEGRPERSLLRDPFCPSAPS